MDMPVEKRKFSRYLIHSPVHVTGTNIKGKDFEEKTTIKDVSGGGVSFYTGRVNDYFPGQPLSLCIALSETRDLRARMTAAATVVRLGMDGTLAADMERSIVSVCTDQPLRFERIDSGNG